MTPPTRSFEDRPVVLGGLNGSGTRVPTQILEGLGFFVGGKLRNSYDCRWWTVLFDRPGWFADLDGPDDPRYRRCLEVFLDAMRGALAPTPSNLRTVLGAFLDNDFSPGWDVPLSMFRTEGVDPDRHGGWGWKDPNTVHHLPYLDAAFDDLRYVLVVRHGLDWALRCRTSMLEDWHAAYDLPAYDPDRPDEEQLLPLWVRVNERARDVGREALGDRFAIVRFEDLCADPEATIRAIADLAGVDADGETVRDLAGLVDPPDTIGIHRDRDLGAFDEQDVAAVESFGYEVG